MLSSVVSAVSNDTEYVHVSSTACHIFNTGTIREQLDEQKRIHLNSKYIHYMYSLQFLRCSFCAFEPSISEKK